MLNKLARKLHACEFRPMCLLWKVDNLIGLWDTDNDLVEFYFVEWDDV